MSSHSLVNRIMPLFAILCVFASVSPAKSDVSGAFMTTQPDGLAYLRLTQTGNKATGYIQCIYADDRNITLTRKSDIHGTVNGSDISLKLDSFFGYGGRDASGKKQGSKLVLEFPTTTGHIRSYIFTPTTTQAWNQNVTVFQRRCAQRIAAAQARAALTARKSWLDEQNTKTTLAVWSSQLVLAGTLYKLENAKSESKKYQEEMVSCQATYLEAEKASALAEQGASTSDERYHASELKFQAQNARYHLQTATSNADNARRDMYSAIKDIENDKSAIIDGVKQNRTYQAEMRLYGMHFWEYPELGKFMAIVKSSNAKIRADPIPTSNILRELREGAFLGIIGTNSVSASVILSGGEKGVADKTNLRFITLDSIGRQKIGHLGRVTVLEIPISKDQDETSIVLTRAKRDTYLCITGEQGDWYEILMQNASKGWVKRVNVHLLDFDVTRDDAGVLDSRETVK